MHREAEYGIAAHWWYEEESVKTGSSKDQFVGKNLYQEKLQWVKNLVNLQQYLQGDSSQKSLNLFRYSSGDKGSDIFKTSVDEDIKAYEGDELNLEDIVKDLEYKMKIAAENLEFEKAAEYRDKIKELMDIKKF